MLKLWPWHDAGGADGSVGRGDPVQWRQWLDRQLIDDSDASEARGYALGLSDGTELSRLDGAQLKDHLAAAMMAGRLDAALGTPVVLRVLTQTARPAAAASPSAPAASSPRAASAAAPAPAAETTFGPDLDVVAQVAVLVQAARDGVPFCEECAKAAAKRGLEAAAA